jgi:RimK family alpha-L-glutamate ligase
MHTIILSARTGWHTDELIRALTERGHSGEVLSYETLTARLGAASSGAERPGARLSSGRASLLEADLVLARIIPGGSLEQIIFRVDALHWIEDLGVPVINSPRCIERTIDKFYTTSLLQGAGLPVPETVVCESGDEALAAVRAMGEVVIKPIFGSLGHGIVRVGDAEVARRLVRPLEQMRSVFYVQRAIDHGGRDLRLFVVGGRVLSAVERAAPAGEWRTNVAIGATARPIGLSPALEDMALRAASVVGADYAGVDLLPSGDGGWFVLEVNGIPGWQGLQQATGIDVAAAVIAHAEQRVATRAGRSRPAEAIGV